nr:retrovirus-related Pol polyprotein from transposon TNT 1-94 [Tanacetum cinerariifolium]
MPKGIKQSPLKKVLLKLAEKYIRFSLKDCTWHSKAFARTPKQNGVVERQNRTLVEAARTMLSAAKVPLFFWAEAISTACFTQNRSLVIPHHDKTPYHIINNRKPLVKFFHIFGSVCYIVRDGENLDKMKGKGDECIFVGYSNQSRAYRVFNKRTRVIMESIHVNFDELPHTVSSHNSSDPAPECQTTALNHDSLSPGRKCQENASHGDKTVTMSNELDLLFSPMFHELLNGSSKVVSKSSAVSAVDAPTQRQQPSTPLNTPSTPAPTCQNPTITPTVISSENINQAEPHAENDQVTDDEFINIFSTPVQDQGETSSRHLLWNLISLKLINLISDFKGPTSGIRARGGQLNAAPVLEVENFTNWKNRFMYHIIRIEPQFENIISNGLFVPMAAGQKKPEAQWTADERKAANLDQNTNHVKDYELALLFGKLKYEENLIDSIYESEKRKSFVSTTPLSTAFFSTSIVQDFQDSHDDEKDTRSCHEYLKDLEKEYQSKSLLAKSKRFFKKGTHRFSSAKATNQTEYHKCGKKGHFVRDYWSKTSVPSYQSHFQPKLLYSSEKIPEMRNTQDFEAKYNKVKAKLALLSSSALAPSSFSSKNKGLIAKLYDWDKEEVSSGDEETKVKALMALTNEERISAGKESARNGEWTKITIKKVHTLLEMEDNYNRKSFLDYLFIDLNYVEEQRNNLLSKHRNLVQELNTCKEQLLILKQAKLDLLTMQHVNTETLKENQNKNLN